jgi:methyl-accepting chemotaxis protein
MHALEVTMSSPAAFDRPQFKRRTYLVDRGFQLKYTAILMVVGAAITALFGTMMYQAHVAATEMMGLPARFKDVVTHSYDDRLLYMVAGIAVVMTLSLALFGVLITHRVAGPLYIIGRYIRELGEGRFPVLRPLRRNDELKAFFTDFQEAVEHLRSRDASDLATIEQALDQVERLAASSPEAAQQLATALVNLKALRDRKREVHGAQTPAPADAPATGAAA